MDFWPFNKTGKTSAQKLAQKQLDDARKYALLYSAAAEESTAFAKMYQERAARLQKSLNQESSAASEIRQDLEALSQGLEVN